LYAEEGGVAWSGVCAPFDLLNAMGLTSCFVEFVGAMLASLGASAATLERAEAAGYGADTCGYHRAVVGAALEGLLPVPRFLVGTSTPCTGGLATLENLARIFDKELFVLHIPPAQSEEAVAYVAKQLRSLVKFVEERTGRPLDGARLAEAMNWTNQTRERLIQVYQLAARVPSPVAGRTLANLGIVAPLFMGTPAGSHVADAFHRQLSESVAAGTSGVPGERLRILWIQNRIQFKNPLIEAMEAEFGAAVVVDELNTIFWDPIDLDEPYSGLARRALRMPLGGSLSYRLGRLRELARTYRVHGAVIPCHWGCRQGTGARGLIQEGLAQVGVPVLNLEVDCVDARNYSPGQMQTRLEAFLEMLAARPSPWE